MISGGSPLEIVVIATSRYRCGTFVLDPSRTQDPVRDASLDSLRDGKATGVEPDQGRAAVELLAIRKIVDAAKAAELRQLIETARLGARPDEVIEATEMDPHRQQVAEAYIQWLNEWREVARVSIARRDYRISLGLAQRRQPGDESDGQEPAPAVPPAAAGAHP